MSLAHDQFLQKQLDLDVITLALVAGASISIFSILILGVANNEYTGSDVPVFEEIDGDILDPTHPFQVEKSSEELKKTFKKWAEEVINTIENVSEYVANLPEAGSGPENPDNSDNAFNNEPNNLPSRNTQPNYGTDSQSAILQNKPLMDIPIIKQSDSILDKIQSVMEDSDQFSMEYCSTERGPGVDLHLCDLRGTNLYGSVLSGADLRDVNLSGVNLRSAVLSNADLSGANLFGADLRGANLEGANLKGANLSDADFSGATLGLRCLPENKSISADLNGDNLDDVNLVSIPFWGYLCILVIE